MNPLYWKKRMVISSGYQSAIVLKYIPLTPKLHIVLSLIKIQDVHALIS